MSRFCFSVLIDRLAGAMSSDAISRDELSSFLKALLVPEQYQDYGPNGLQIEGCAEISRVAFAVSATADSIRQAIEWKADALIVHHGLFWRFHGPRPLTGAFGRRVKPLVQADVNLFGYHLPLDAHLEVGNAAGLARRLGLGELAGFAVEKGAALGCSGRWPSPITASQLAERLKVICNHPVMISSPGLETRVQSVGIVTGGGNRYWRHALDAGLDAFITGEMSEHDWNEAQEDGMCYFAAGHHATERFGVLDLQALLKKRFAQLQSCFIDAANPA